MDAISHPLTVHYDAPADARSELARHRFDLRIHALIMLLSGALSAYCGIRILGIGDIKIVDGTGRQVLTGMPPDLLSMSALAIFVPIAAYCFLEAHRCWRRATTRSARLDPDHGPMPRRREWARRLVLFGIQSRPESATNSGSVGVIRLR